MPGLCTGNRTPQFSQTQKGIGGVEMKYNAYLAVFSPWLLFLVAWGDPAMSRTWTLLSPFWIAGAILVAYREGRKSTK